MRILSFVLVMLITGCVAKHSPLQVDPSVSVDSWQMKGRLAARVDRQGDSASFVWDREQEQHNIELFGPLGSGRVFLTQSNGQASIRDKDSYVIGDSLEQVLFENVGWLVPFEAINYWITGKPDPNNTVSNQQFEGDSLIGFEQSSWQVDYQNFKSFGTITIPTKITIQATPDYLEQLSQDLNKTVSKVTVKLIVKEFAEI